MYTIVQTDPLATPRKLASGAFGNTDQTLHLKVLDNKLSVNAAMIEAGFRKKTYSIEATREAVLQFIEKHNIIL